MFHRSKQLMRKWMERTAPASPAIPSPPAWHRGIWCPIVGGLANQLICYRVGRMLADTHGIPLLADISHFQSPGSRPFLLPNFSPVFDILFNSSDQSAGWCGQADDLLSKITTRDTPHFWNSETQEQIRSSFLATPPTPVLADLWVGLAFQIAARDYFRQPQNATKLAFQTGTLSESEAAFLQQITHCEQTIAVHVRRTDFASHDGGLLAPAAQYNEAIAHIESTVGKCRVFVFSDDQPWCEQNIKAAGTICHSPVRGEENGHVDMYLASRCRHKVLTSESTFSQLIDAISHFNAADRIIVRCSRRCQSPIYEEYLHA